MPLIWVIDSSSIIEMKQVSLNLRPQVIAHLDHMVAQGRLVYPYQVLAELKEYAPRKALKQDLAYMWAKKNQAKASHSDLLLSEAKAILRAHRDLIDPDKAGKDPADPYVIALAQKLRGEGHDARIVTNDTRQINKKVSVARIVTNDTRQINKKVSVAAVPSTVMRIFLRGEGFNY